MKLVIDWEGAKPQPVAVVVDKRDTDRTREQRLEDALVELARAATDAADAGDAWKFRADEQNTERLLEALKGLRTALETKP